MSVFTHPSVPAVETGQGAGNPTPASLLPVVGGGRPDRLRGVAADLGLTDTWASALVPGAVGTTTVNTVDFIVTDPGAPGGPLHVIATIPAAQAASGKLFSRLKGDP